MLFGKNLKSTLLVGLLSLSSLCYAYEADRLQELPSVEHTLALVEHHSERLALSKKEILEEQYAIIDGKDLQFWGIGLFAGSEPVSKIVRAITDSPWSHVALVLSDQINQLYCLESTGSFNDILKKGMLPQVQINYWDDVVRTYEGRIAYRQFSGIDKSLYEKDQLTDYVKPLLGVPYEKDLTSLINCLHRKNKQESLDSLFCSELVAMILMDWKLLQKDRLSNNYLPKDFAMNEYLPLLNVSLEWEVIVKQNTKRKECIII